MPLMKINMFQWDTEGGVAILFPAGHNLMGYNDVCKPTKGQVLFSTSNNMRGIMQAKTIPTLNTETLLEFNYHMYT